MATTEVKIPCRYCTASFPTWEEVAIHTIAGGKTHRASRKWAQKVLMKQRKLDRPKRPERAELSDEEKEKLSKYIRQPSGATKSVRTICPFCRKEITQELPQEYADSPFAWRARATGVLVVSCATCASSKESRRHAQTAKGG